MGSSPPKSDLNRQLLQSLADNVEDYAIFAIDPEGLVNAWTKSAERLLGYAETDVLGKTADAFFTAHDVAVGLPALERSQAELVGQMRADRWSLRKAGAVFWSRVIVKALRNEVGELQGFAVTLRNLSATTHSPAPGNDAIPSSNGNVVAAHNDELMATLQRSEQFHRAISELSTDYAFAGTIGEDGSVELQTVTEGFRKFYGIDLEEMNARGGWGAVIHPDDHPRVGKTIEKLLAGETDRSELRGICEDGSVKWQIYVTVPIRDPETGRTVGLYGAARDVTSQRMLTEQLRERSDSLSAILNATVDNIYLLDKEGRYRYVSQSGADVIGLTPEAMRGKHWRELGISDEIMSPFDIQRDQVLASGKPQRHEISYTDPTGYKHHYEYSVSPVSDGKGGFDAVVVMSRDDTERKRAEERLRETSATLSSFYETAPLMMGVVEVVDDDILHLTDNAAACRFFGVEPGALSGRFATELCAPPDAIRRWCRSYRESERTGCPIRFEYLHETQEGPRWVSAIVYCIERLATNRSRCSYVAEDVTERKQVEEALREAEQRWRGLAEALPNLVWTCLRDGRCDYMSSQWEAYTGIPVHELLRFDWLDEVIHPDDRQRTRDCWLTAVAEKGDYDLEYRIRRHDGQYHWFKTRGVPIRDGQDRIIKWFGTCTDIEDQKRAVEALSESDRRKDEFLATLAHELRNPLAPIRSSLQILKMPRIDAVTAKLTQDVMERQVHHLVRLVDDLLDVSRVMRGKIELRREPVELATVVARAVETAQSLIDAQGHRLNVDLPVESLLLYADPVRLTQVVGNLLMNSAKYMDANGQIWVSALRDGDRVTLKVRDQGIGISPELLPRVFDLFVQADHATTKAQGGLGIGLTLVKSLVEMHSGRVQATSPGLGKGCEVVVELPLLVQLGQRTSDASSEDLNRESSKPGSRVLVVDDNRDAALSLSMLLRLQGNDVRVAYDGPTALEVAVDFRPNIIFLDIGMPGMDGYEVARRLRRMPVVANTVLAALTGWGQDEDRRRTAEAGFDHHLVKPPEPTMIEQLLGSLNSRNA